MTISKKLKIGMGIPLVIFLLFALVSYTQTRWIQQSLERITEVEQPRSAAASKMEIDLVGTGFELVGYLQDRNLERLDLIEEYEKGFREHQEIYGQLSQTRETEKSASAIDKDYAVFSRAAEELVHLENLQAERLALLEENFGQTDVVLSEAFKVHQKPQEQGSYDKLETLMRMKIKAGQVRQDLSSYICAHQSLDENKIYGEQEELRILADVYKNQHQASEHKEWFDRFDSIHARSRKLVREVVALERKKTVELKEFVKARESLRSALAGNLEKAQESFEYARQISRKAIGMSTIVTLVLVFVGLVIALISQTYIATAVTLPITQLRDAAARICQGRYDTKVKIESNGELGELADSIGRMAEQLKESNGIDHESAEREKAGVAG